MSFSAKINSLFAEENWEEAQRLLIARRKREPTSHWVLTQLAATFYEQQKYGESFGLLLKSHKLVKDCPLTLWHLAGACDALGRADDALPIYA